MQWYLGHSLQIMSSNQLGLLNYMFSLSSPMSKCFTTELCPYGKATGEDGGISPALLCGRFLACLWQVAVSV